MTEKSYRILVTLSKYHEKLLHDISKSEGLSCAEILRLGLVAFHTQTQIKNNPNLCKLMHGAHFKEPQTTKQCYNVNCYECAYQSSIQNEGGCAHYDTMKEAEQ